LFSFFRRYDVLTLKTRWEKPNLVEHMTIRLKRSYVVKDLGDWKQYRDPLFKKGYLYWHHRLSGELRLTNPFGDD
jgi:hypothetical protein